MFTTDMLIGGLAGMISRTLTAPLELNKIQRQNHFMPNASLREVIQKEGVFSLWKGNGTNVVRIFPQMAINYSVYSMMNQRLKGVSLQKDLHHFICGGIAGMTSMTVIYPFENIRTRLSLQTNQGQYKGLVDVVRKTPISQLYGGLRMSLLGFTPYNALNFMFYNNFKRQLEKRDIQLGAWNHLLCGGLSGSAAVTFTYPTDLIRRRLQIQGMNANVPEYSGIFDVMKKIYKGEGIMGFYRGLLPCYIKIFPTLALQFYCIETMKNGYIKIDVK